MKIIKYLVFFIVLILVNLLLFFLKETNLWLVNGFFVIAGLLFFWYQKQKDESHKQEIQTYENIINRISNTADKNTMQMRMLVNNLPSPIALFSAEGVLEIYNPGFQRFIKDYNSKEIYHYDDSSFFVDVLFFLRKAFDKEENFILRLNIMESEYQAFSLLLQDKEGTNGRLIIFQDITRAINEENRQKQFIADASHELKTPISVLKGMLEILNRPDFDDDKIASDFIRQMSNETDRLENLVRELLAVSKINSETTILERQEVDLASIIKAVIKSITPLYLNKNLKIVNEFNYPETIFGDGEKLYTLFNNLFINAIQYSEEGIIKVSNYESEEYLVIEISDSGIGIEEKQLKEIFQRFYRVDSSRNRNLGGTGLGLAIVKSIVDAHNGLIEIKSKRKQGTTVTVKLIKS